MIESKYALTISNLKKKYPGTEALKGIDLQLPMGGNLWFIGPPQRERKIHAFKMRGRPCPTRSRRYQDNGGAKTFSAHQGADCLYA